MQLNARHNRIQVERVPVIIAISWCEHGSRRGRTLDRHLEPTNRCPEVPMEDDEMKGMARAEALLTPMTSRLHPQAIRCGLKGCDSRRVGTRGRGDRAF